MSSLPASGTPQVASWPIKMGMVRAMTCAHQDGKPLSGIALRVGWALLDRTNAETGECRWYLSVIHGDLCRSGDTLNADSVRRAIRSLEAAGLLRVQVSVDGRSPNNYLWSWDRALPLRPLTPRKNVPPEKLRPPENLRPPPRNDTPPPPENLRGNISEEIIEEIREENNSIPPSPFGEGDDEARLLLHRLAGRMSWTALGRAANAKGIKLSKSVLRQFAIAPKLVSNHTAETIRAATPALRDILNEEEAKTDPSADKIIQRFDRIYTDVFGHKRPRIHRNDAMIAHQWIDADPNMLDWQMSCLLQRFKAEKGRPPTGLSSIRFSIDDALKDAR